MIVYHFVNAEHGLSNLIRRRLKIATIADINDPFELRSLSLLQPAQRTAARDFRQSVAEETGMLCFSRRWSNPVQWSHYADRHRGLCLGFDVPREILQKVSYSPRRLHIDLVNGRGPGPAGLAMLKKLLSTKYSHWRYEQEERVFTSLVEKDPEVGLYFIDFNSHLKLVEVIVGAESKITRQEIAGALGELTPAVKVHKARLAFGTYRIVRQRQPSLWA